MYSKSEFWYFYGAASSFKDFLKASHLKAIRHEFLSNISKSSSSEFTLTPQSLCFSNYDVLSNFPWHTHPIDWEVRSCNSQSCALLLFTLCSDFIPYTSIFSLPNAEIGLKQDTSL